MRKSLFAIGAVLVLTAEVATPGALAVAAPQSSTAQPSAPSFQLTQGDVRQMQDEIRRVQQALNEKGYHPGKADGVIRPRTVRALREFQRDRGIKTTGRIDDRTTAALNVPGLGNRHAGSGEGQPSTTGSR
jgi:peptidoglycan hydrolase-like protein with peptidoglycan-binding domain